MNSLSAFIESNLTAILADWETFARSVGPAGMSGHDLRNDAEKILRFVAADMEAAQTAHQQQLKSEGRGPQPEEDSAAHDHGLQRFGHGFDMSAMVSEYRALRATVIRLWAANNPTPMEIAMQQLVRFSESVDQAIAESIARYTTELDKSRDLFLAALGHDLRTPLGTIGITAEGLLHDPSDVNRERGARILRSTRALGNIANDLLDFTRTRMGGKLPLQLATVDAREVAVGVCNELGPAYPDRAVALRASGETTLRADPARLAQALMNLVLNALQHGGVGSAVDVHVTGTPDEVVIEVRNGGEPIPQARIPHLFEPWTRTPGNAQPGNSGLGLFIVRQIAEGHDGTVDVSSSRADGTAFTLRLPRAGPRSPQRPAP